MSKLDETLKDIIDDHQYIDGDTSYIEHQDADGFIVSKDRVKNLFRQLVIDSIEEDPINTLEVLRRKIGAL